MLGNGQHVHAVAIMSEMGCDKRVGWDQTYLIQIVRRPHTGLPRLGPNYTILNFSGELVAPDLIDAFAAANMPLEVLDCPQRPEPYDHAYVLARTDQHVAWRGDGLPG